PLKVLRPYGVAATLGKFALLFGLVILLASFLAALAGRRPWRQVLVLSWCDFVLGLLVGLAVSLSLSLAVWPLGGSPAGVVTLGVPLLLLALVLAGCGEMALLGGLLDEYEREWRSRIGAHLLRLAAGWLVFFGTTLYVAWLLQHPEVIGPGLRAAAAAAWVGVSAAAAWAGRSPRTRADSRLPSRLLEGLAAVGPPVFLLGLLAALSLLVAALPPRAAGDLLAAAGDPSAAALDRWGGWLLAWLALAVLFAGVINVNSFSL